MRRHMLGFAIKKNSITVNQLSEVMGKCHLKRVNLPFEMNKSRLLAYNRKRLMMYLDSSKPTIGIKQLQYIISEDLKSFMGLEKISAFWMYKESDAEEKIDQISRSGEKNQHIYRVYSYLNSKDNVIVE